MEANRSEPPRRVKQLPGGIKLYASQHEGSYITGPFNPAERYVAQIVKKNPIMESAQ